MQIPKVKKKRKKDPIKAKADKLWGKLIHMQRVCAVCGTSDGQLHAHHIVSRVVTHLRHDPENGLLLCATHHNFDPEISPHAGPIGFSEWLKEHYPAKFELALTKRHSTGKADYRLAVEKLEKAIREF